MSQHFSFAGRDTVSSCNITLGAGVDQTGFYVCRMAERAIMAATDSPERPSFLNNNGRFW